MYIPAVASAYTYSMLMFNHCWKGVVEGVSSKDVRSESERWRWRVGSHTVLSCTILYIVGEEHVAEICKSGSKTGSPDPYQGSQSREKGICIIKKKTLNMSDFMWYSHSTNWLVTVFAICRNAKIALGPKRRPKSLGTTGRDTDVLWGALCSY